MTTANTDLAIAARIASLGAVDISGISDFCEAHTATMDAVYALADMCEAISDEVAIEYWLENFVTQHERMGHCDPAEHAENVEKMREYESEKGFDVIPRGSDEARTVREFALNWDISRLRSAVEWLAACGAEDDLGTLDALRAGVLFEHVFA